MSQRRKLNEHPKPVNPKPESSKALTPYSPNPKPKPTQATALDSNIYPRYLTTPAARDPRAGEVEAGRWVSSPYSMKLHIVLGGPEFLGICEATGFCSLGPGVLKWSKFQPKSL